ncbi:MAG: 5-oxoprolinase subunit PxpB [Desulfurococcales archaeon]|nr:5-oxoprolinase subunit PxpB [Desulfurococcales archaeon]
MSNPMQGVKIKLTGGYVIHMEMCGEISRECNDAVLKAYHTILKMMREGEVKGIEEVVPTYTALTVFYDPRKTTWRAVSNTLKEVISESSRRSFGDVFTPKQYEIPVAYGGVWGPDLVSVASEAGLTEDEVIRVHTSRSYRCYMLGFTPGFLYLGEVDERIAVPRLKNPRVKVPAGSVGIAGLQTGVYGIESPGGWRIIGRTPLKMFDPRRVPPTPIRPGDLVRFFEVGEEEFRELKEVFIGEFKTR